ncbi:MAG TPA: hypothetical protein VL651_04695 [Bacteroidia bacterium]|jgi:hypothetical protein|nr:hypothetical protein [Bacteroidia bacterium]
MEDLGQFLYNNNRELFLWIGGLSCTLLFAGKFPIARTGMVILYFICLLLIFTYIFIEFDDLSTDHPSWLYLALLILPVFIVFAQLKLSGNAGQRKRTVLYGIFTGMCSAVITTRMIHYGWPDPQWGPWLWQIFTLTCIVFFSVVIFLALFFISPEKLTSKKILYAGIAAGSAILLYRSMTLIGIYYRYSHFNYDIDVFKEAPVSHQLMWRIPYFMLPQLTAAVISGAIVLFWQKTIRQNTSD